MHGMPSLLQIRNVPESTRQALKARAASRGESLNTFLVQLLDREAGQPTVAEVLARAARRAEQAQVSAVEVFEAARSERDTTLHVRPTA